MMENSAGKGHLPCSSWLGQNGWSTASTPGGPPLNSVASSQHLGLGSSSGQRSSYNHLQTSNQSCLSDLCTLSSTNNILYKAPHVSNHPPPSTMIFHNTGASPLMSCAQQSPQNASVLLQKTVPPPPLPQTNQGLQLSRPQHLPPPLPHDPYKAPFRPPLISQGLQSGLEDASMSLPSSQPTLDGASADVAGYAHSYGGAVSHQQPQWAPSSHCGGAVKPVPESAASSNNELLPENVAAQANNDIWRSALLLHRAELVKQLAEMDKLLQSIPPDDSADGLSQPTTIQFPPSMVDLSQCEQTKTSRAQVQVEPPSEESMTQQTHCHSDDCASPAPFDDHDEACDNPMSPREPEKLENMSSESEDDNDPDYLPNTGGDISDSQSDGDGSSSDESSGSCLSTSAVEASPLPVKEEAKSESCSDEDITESRANDKKSPHKALVLSTLNWKVVKNNSKKNYCLFCSKPQTKIARHLERAHSDKAEVAVAFQYPAHSSERLKIWKNLMKQGNFEHNKEVLRTGNGQLNPYRRPTKSGEAKDFIHCLYCQGLYLKKSMCTHMKQCSEKVKNGKQLPAGKRRIALRCALQTLGDLGLTDGFRDLLCEMIYDDITQAVLDDKIILQFGENQFNLHRSDLKRHDIIRQNLRQIARLVLEARKITPLRNLQDFFSTSSFRHVVSAVKVLAGYDSEKKTYSAPSLAIKLGYLLQKTCGIVESNAEKSGDASLAQSAQNFLQVYQKKWCKLISSGALTSLKELKRSRDKTVPLAEDVKRLNFHMESAYVVAEKNLRDAPTAENYAALARLTLARTMFFNRRSTVEISTIHVTAFMSRKKSNALDDMDDSVSDLERTMCRFFVRVDVRGGTGRMVPVLLKPSFVSALELIVETREAAGVPSKNPFLFARPATLSFYRGSECIQHFVRECGAQNPEALKLIKIRKHYATMLQMLNLDDEEANQILGPNNPVRSLQQGSNLQLDDVKIRSKGRSKQAPKRHQQAHGQTTGIAGTAFPKSVNSDSKGSQSKGKQKWDDAEVHAVERHMMSFIKDHIVPQKNDCIQCLEAEPKALRTRTWKGVKDYVRNRITALKRQSGTSTESNRPAQKKPRQSAGRFQQL